GSTRAGFSKLHILAQTTVDLVPGENQISLATKVSGSQSFDKCLASGEADPNPNPTPNIVATLSSQPSNPSSETVLSVAVGGVGVSQYKIKVGSASTNCASSADYSAAYPVVNVIASNVGALADGILKLCVVGGNDQDQWQPFSNPTEYTWVKDTSPPTGTLAINGGASYTTATGVTLSMTATDSSGPLQMYVTSTTGCSTGGTWESFSSTKPWTLASANASNSVYV